MKKKKKIKDQVKLGPEIAPGVRQIVRRRGNEFEVGVMTPVKEGVPIPEGTDLIRVGEECGDGWQKAEVLFSNRSGPAQVVTPAYREGYDRIFGGKQKVAEA